MNCQRSSNSIKEGQTRMFLLRNWSNEMCGTFVPHSQTYKEVFSHFISKCHKIMLIFSLLDRLSKCKNVFCLIKYIVKVLIVRSVLFSVFSQTCAAQDAGALNISCGDNSYIWIDQEFTYFSDDTFEGSDTCSWTISNNSHVRDTMPDLFNEWANSCNLKTQCNLQHNISLGHLTVSFTCERGIILTLYDLKIH